MPSNESVDPNAYPADTPEATYFVIHEYNAIRIEPVNVKIHPNFGASDPFIERLRPVSSSQHHFSRHIQEIVDPEDHDPTGGYYSDPHGDLADK